MREKLLSLMRSEGLTSSRLAELLGIQPSGISHILSGRNKPSFDFVQKILRRFPTLNPDWLLLDQGPMYRETKETSGQSPLTVPASAAEQSDRLFGDDTSLQPQMPAPTSEAATMQSSPTDTPNNMAADFAANHSQHGRVKRVIVLYEDLTFESYNPSR